MESLFVVRFVRRDGHPSEEYYYGSFEEALFHFNMFENDTSNIYKRIEIYCYSTPDVIEREISFY